VSAQLEALANEFRAVNDRARALVGRVGLERLVQRPASGGWSVAEILDHLVLTTRAFLPRWEQASREAREGGLQSDGPYKTDFMGKSLIWILEPPYRMKVQTTPPFRPATLSAPDEVLPAFLASQDELLAALFEGRGLALDKVQVTSPFQEKMKYSAWSSFRIAAAHQRRHLWQAEQISA
jgi:hypothetical protein